MSKIHQEVSIPASPSKVYEALVNMKRFSDVTGAPASGDGKEGATFSAFGGHITGRNVELVQDQRIVQAWRAKNWTEGEFSIVRFSLSADGKGTKIVFDHEAFPKEMEEHLSKGWHSNYWDKLNAHFA